MTDAKDDLLERLRDNCLDYDGSVIPDGAAVRSSFVNCGEMREIIYHIEALTARNATLKAQVEALAEHLATYLTGSNVAAASIALELGGHGWTMAAPYFALREALGITGYACRDEALAALALKTEQPK